MTERYLTPDSDPPSDPSYREDDTRTRIEKMRVKGEATAKASEDHESRLRSIEAWPLRVLLAVLGSAAVLAGIGVAAIQSQTRVETALEAVVHRLERLEDQADEDRRESERAWRSVPTREE